MDIVKAAELVEDILVFHYFDTFPVNQGEPRYFLWCIYLH